MANHTPTPWGRLSAGSIHSGPHTIVHFRHISANPFNDDFENEREANAALIVKAVNNHERMVNALEAIRDACPIGFQADAVKVRSITDAALAGLETENG